jgi:hypothetical protein
MLLDMLIETGEVFGAITLLAGLMALYPRTRRVAYATLRFCKRHMSPWMLAVVGACVFFPGQVDEAIVIPILLALVLRDARKRAIFRRYLVIAWNPR